MKTRTCLLILVLAFCLTTSVVRADLDFGPLLENDMLINSTAPSGDSAAVAFDGINYLVVWSQPTEYEEEEKLLDIYGRLVSRTGLPVTEPFPIISKPANQYQPAVAFNGTHYLVVWADNMGSASWDTINGRAVSTAGVPLGEELVISTAWDNGRGFPAVASNGVDFLVVWQDFSNYSLQFGDIFGRQVQLNSAGQVELGLNWQSTRPGQQFFPSIAFGGGRYLITWAEDATPSANMYDVLATLVDPGTLRDGGVFAVSTAPSWQGSRPAGIAYGSGMFLVTFDDHREGGTQTAVYGVRITKEGILLDGPPESGGILISSAATAGSGGPNAPQTEFANGEWLVAWAGQAVRGARVSLAGEVLDVNGVALSRTAVSQFEPALATDGQSYLITWQQSAAFTKFAQLVGYSLMGDTLRVNSMADPGDGVCTPAECTLREAIRVANQAPGSATIYLPAGTITLAAPGRNEDAAVTGDLDITDDLTIIGKSETMTFIDAGELDRVVHVLAGVDVTLAHMTLRNGFAGDGGGILNEGNLILTQSTVTQNHVNYDTDEGEWLGGNSAGGILNWGSLRLNRCHVTGNYTDYYMGDGPGGGILNAGKLTIVNSNFRSNWAAGGSGLFNSGNVTIQSSIFENNSVRFFGGAIQNRPSGTITMNRTMVRYNMDSIYNQGSMTMTDSIVAGNTGYRVTGGILNEGSLTFSGSTLNDNDGPEGALISFGTATLINSTISHNSSIFAGVASGVSNSHGSLTLLNCTVADNYGGGVGLLTKNNGSTLVQNSIIANNANLNCLGPAQSGGNNLDGDGSCGFSGVGDLTAVPLLGPLQENGGFTQTMALLSGSPAIDHIPSNACAVTSDQRGIMRPQGGACEIGAFELVP